MDANDGAHWPTGADNETAALDVAPWLVVAAGAYIVWALSQAQLERYAMVWLLLVVPAAFGLEQLAHLGWR